MMDPALALYSFLTFLFEFDMIVLLLLMLCDDRIEGLLW